MLLSPVILVIFSSFESPTNFFTYNLNSSTENPTVEIARFRTKDRARSTTTATNPLTCPFLQYLAGLFSSTYSQWVFFVFFFSSFSPLIFSYLFNCLISTHMFHLFFWFSPSFLLGGSEQIAVWCLAVCWSKLQYPDRVHHKFTLSNLSLSFILQFFYCISRNIYSRLH